MQSDGAPDAKLYVWDIEQDAIQFFNFATGHGEQDEDSLEDEENADISDVER